MSDWVEMSVGLILLLIRFISSFKIRERDFPRPLRVANNPLRCGPVSEERVFRTLTFPGLGLSVVRVQAGISAENGEES